VTLGFYSIAGFFLMSGITSRTYHHIALCIWLDGELVWLVGHPPLCFGFHQLLCNDWSWYMYLFEAW